VLFAESADEYALVKRESRTGMLLAFLPLGNKMASSLGKFAAGVVMQWTALRPGPKAAPAGAAALQHLGVATVALTSVAGLLALMFFLQYRLPRSRYAEILRGLEAERAAVPELR
jgi:Na+/melibiose symporter-like transporter